MADSNIPVPRIPVPRIAICWLTTPAILLATLVSSPKAQETVIPAIASSSVADQQLTLKDELRYGLRARRPAEIIFIDRVVSHVKKGQLTLPMVRSTFIWARQQSTRRPYPFFEFGLRARAKRIGVSL